MSGTPPTHPLPSLIGSKSAAICNLTVRLLNEYTGRGPTKARTYINDDVVTVVLRDTLTKAEVALASRDHGPTVLATRRTVQEMMGPELIRGVEQITARTVLAFVSASHIAPDIAVQTFILAPAEDAAPDASPRDTSTPERASMASSGG